MNAALARKPTPEHPDTRLQEGQYESSVATLEDKIVQRAVVGVLNAVYEADFRGFSYGFRPRRGPHQALDALATGITTRRVNWVLDADIRDFFGQLDRDWLGKFLRHRIADERVLRLIGKWLAAGVIEDGTWAETGRGSPQGALCSAAHKPPYEQCWVMRSASLPGLVTATLAFEHCA